MKDDFETMNEQLEHGGCGCLAVTIILFAGIIILICLSI